MRIAIRMATVPDGGITRVYLVAQDRDRPSDDPWAAEYEYDSGIYPPDREGSVQSYVCRILAQLEAKIERDGLEVTRQFVADPTAATPPL